MSNWDGTPLANLLRGFKVFTGWFAFLLSLVLYFFGFVSFANLADGGFVVGVTLIVMATGCMAFSRVLAQDMEEEDRKRKFYGDEE